MSSEKKEQSQKQKNNDDFQKVVISDKMQELKKISVLRKKEQSQKQKITTTFGTSLFMIKYRKHYAIYILPNTKDLAINHTMVPYGNRQNATAFARANNSDLLRSLKHLMETRL